MVRNMILGLATLAVCLFIGTTARADDWKDESGKGRGWGGHKKEWKEKDKDWKKHDGETPGWARGKSYWDGHYKHGRPPQRHWGDYDDHYQGGRQYWSQSYEAAPAPHYGSPPSPPQPYYGRVPYGWPKQSPYQYNSDPYGQGWDIEGSIRIRPRSDW